MHSCREYADAGGLTAYGADRTAIVPLNLNLKNNHKREAHYAAKRTGLLAWRKKTSLFYYHAAIFFS